MVKPGSQGCSRLDNGYISGASRLTPTSATDVILGPGPNYRTSTLGRFYLSSGSALIDNGSRSAAAAGLYHYTTQTDQTKDTLNVDIGHHYVALSGGVPVDSDNDGWPDVVEDANGSGSVNSGETDWQNASDSGLKVLITEPKANANVP